MEAPQAVITTGGLPGADPLLAGLREALAGEVPVAGPVDLGGARLPRGPAAFGDLLQIPFHVHVAGEPPDVLHLLRAVRAAEIPLHAAARPDEAPLLVLAGPAALPNPEPFAGFFEGILVGDPAETAATLAKAWAVARGRGRRAVPEAWLGCEGAYVPAAYRARYGEDGLLAALEPSPGAPKAVPARWEPPSAAVSPEGRPGITPLAPGLWGWDHRQGGRPRGLTALLGAAHEALRRRVGIGLSDAAVEALLDCIVETGAEQVELEFTLGIPGESDDDVDAIVGLVKRLRHRLLQARRGPGGGPEIVPAVTTFFPHPWTPTQWAPLADVRDLARRHKELARAVGRIGNVSLLHDVPKWTYVQALLARGDRRVGALLGLVLEAEGDWMAACRRWHLNADFFVYRSRQAGEIFPWDHLDVGISKERLREAAEDRGLLSQG